MTGLLLQYQYQFTPYSFSNLRSLSLTFWTSSMLSDFCSRPIQFSQLYQLLLSISFKLKGLKTSSSLLPSLSALASSSKIDLTICSVRPRLFPLKYPSHSLWIGSSSTNLPRSESYHLALIRCYAPGRFKGSSTDIFTVKEQAEKQVTFCENFSLDAITFFHNTLFGDRWQASPFNQPLGIVFVPTDLSRVKLRR
jgi:hypothetical protein